MSDANADLDRQARRLRFTDPAWERRFRDERQSDGLTRARAMMVLGIFAVCALGLVDVAINVRFFPDYSRVSLGLRFLVATPVWLAMLVSTALRGHPARADAVYAVGTTIITWALALLPWWFLRHVHPDASIAQQVDINVLSVVMISVAALPMRFPAIVGTTVASIGGVIAWFLLTPGLTGLDQRVIPSMLSCMGLLILALSWYRERAERRMFGQREQVRVLNAELARLNAEKSEFLAIASHDLRAPLASVRGLAGQLRDGQLEEAARRAQAVGAIHDLAGGMLSLVNDYLGAHAVESGTVPVNLTRLDLQAVAEEMQARHTPVAAKKDQPIAVARGPAVWAHGDAARLAQVVDNFVTNALKFSARGRAVRLTVTRAEDGRAARLEVSDDGPGIAADEIANLFKKSTRGRAQPTGGETSHGLGLAVAKRIAESMGGTVGCDSTLGAGATFWIALPAAR